jgi:four helix bundle protein
MPSRLHRDSFGYRKLEVYRRANQFFRSAYILANRLQRGDGFIKSQFLRAALSIKLNIAEGSGEMQPLEKARLYRIARRSADECSAMLEDIEFVLNLKPLELEPYYEELQVITVMLIRLDESMTKRAEAAGKPSTPRKRKPPSP